MLAAHLAALALAVFTPAPVSSLVGAPVDCYPTVTAWNAADQSPPNQAWWLGVAGFYDFGTGRVGLTPNVCTSLARVGKGYLTLTQAMAIFTVAHEWGHVVGGWDETTADCYGAKHAPQVAYLLGLRGNAAFFELRTFIGDYAGYAPIPAACFA